MLTLPFFQTLQDAQRILLAGAGGGFDIFAGLPLYFALQDAGKDVHLANLSFSWLEEAQETRKSPALSSITADTESLQAYFPERFLAQWFRQEQKQDITIYCFERTGVQPILAAYQHLVETLNLDTIVLVDGGTDSLMRGDEEGLGTPHEDMASIAAVHALPQQLRKLIACIGFGVDHYHGVSNSRSLEAIADLTQQGAFLGMLSLVQSMPEAQAYQHACEFVFQHMPDAISIVNSSILSSLHGHYGDHHATTRTQRSTLWINPLMPAYWFFQLEPLAQRILYLPQLLHTQTYHDIGPAIHQGLLQHKPNPTPKIPIPD